MLPMLGNLDIVTKTAMMSIIKENNVQVHTRTALVEVTSDHFQVIQNEKEVDLPFDYGFVCLGIDLTTQY